MTEKQQLLQQNTQLSSELALQVSLLNARINNVNLANADMLKEIDSVFRSMAVTIATLQQENAELKAKFTETRKE
jgi:hypothetical protein